jgi:FkbM family methyltransferase
MNLRNLTKYILFKDTTFKGEFRAMQRLAGPDCPRIIVDVGAHNGFYGSNSFPFIARGWRAILIEPHPGTFEKLQKLHAGKRKVTCLNLACAETSGQRPLYFGVNNPGGSHATLCTDDTPRFRQVRSENYHLVRVERLDEVLAKQGVPFEFGILSVDAECMDYEVLLGLDLKQWRPRVIITEDYEPKDKLKTEYLTKHGYRHAGQCTANAIWVREV